MGHCLPSPTVLAASGVICSMMPPARQCGFLLARHIERRGRQTDHRGQLFGLGEIGLRRSADAVGRQFDDALIGLAAQPGLDGDGKRALARQLREHTGLQVRQSASCIQPGIAAHAAMAVLVGAIIVGRHQIERTVSLWSGSLAVRPASALCPEARPAPALRPPPGPRFRQGMGAQARGRSSHPAAPAGRARRLWRCRMATRNRHRATAQGLIVVRHEPAIWRRRPRFSTSA